MDFRDAIPALFLVIFFKLTYSHVFIFREDYYQFYIWLPS
jgi:hypothetical protein